MDRDCAGVAAIHDNNKKTRPAEHLRPRAAKDERPMTHCHGPLDVRHL